MIVVHVFETVCLVFVAMGCFVTGVDTRQPHYLMASALFVIAAIMNAGL